jgi:NADH-quinone oxidoreductase subunit A
MPPATINAAYGTTAGLGDYLGLLIILLLATFIACLLVGLSWILGPKHLTKEKLMPYECGVNPIGNARERFPVKYYLIAMLFILFDIETVFLYPWAVTFKSGVIAKTFELSEMIVFIAILAVGYIYVWKKGALDWE